METRSRKRREISPCSSSSSQKKRKLSLKETIPISRKNVHISSLSTDMMTPLNNAQDVAFLILLKSVCTREETSIGYSFTFRFWDWFARLLSTKVGKSISTYKCIQSAKYHNMIHDTCQRTPHLTTHPVMDQNLYWSALNTIYAKSMRINPKYPPESGEGSGGSRAGSGGPIRTRETSTSSNTCSSSGRRQMDGSRDEWIEWEPLLAAALASLHSADLVSIVEVDQVSALFKRSATHVTLRLFLGKNLQSDQVKIIREMLENPPAV